MVSPAQDDPRRLRWLISGFSHPPRLGRWTACPYRAGRPLLLGRERDIAELDEALALAAQGTPQIVLVGGDAGIGKTTLVADLERRAGELGFTVATGHGLDLEAGISFAPVVEAVRSLLAGVEDLGSRPSARRMLTLLDPDAPRSREAFHVLDDLTAAVLEAAAAGPVLLVLEDMHWADRSTQDFAATLSRTARGGLLLVLTFRSDELHRRHPFRKTLTEISRTPGARRIDLARVGPRRHCGHRRRPHRRAARPVDGRFCAGAVRGQPAVRRGAPGRQPGRHRGSPTTSRICCWPASTPSTTGPRALLRLASVNGTRLDTETLAELAGLDQAQMEGYLREALDANVLRQTADVPGVPASAAARGRLRRPDARRTDPDPRPGWPRSSRPRSTPSPIPGWRR